MCKLVEKGVVLNCKQYCENFTITRVTIVLDECLSGEVPFAV